MELLKCQRLGGEREKDFSDIKASCEDDLLS